jgi:hypothetical protein
MFRASLSALAARLMSPVRCSSSDLTCARQQGPKPLDIFHTCFLSVSCVRLLTLGIVAWWFLRPASPLHGLAATHLALCAFVSTPCMALQPHHVDKPISSRQQSTKQSAERGQTYPVVSQSDQSRWSKWSVKANIQHG